MIKYNVSAKQIAAAIKKADSTWYADAAVLKPICLKAGKITEKQTIWGRIKHVFAAFQKYKCIYCESALPTENHDMGRGSVEYDVEHYRPKKKVVPWPNAALKKKRAIKYGFALRSGNPSGYLRLAFDPLNYAVSCKTCNTGHKGNHFPITGTAQKSGERRTTLDNKEKPLLMLPIGDTKENPEDILGWVGPMPVPLKRAGYGRQRAQVCIDFFSLDTRDNLVRERASTILLLGEFLEKDRKRSTQAKQIISALTADDAPMAGCARAFVKLFAQNRSRAQEVLAICARWLPRRDRAMLTSLVI